jgi:peptidoglycan/xylan/chitin deacetylase (PgdA/CDA1 family)
MPTGHADDSKGVFLASVDPIRSQPVPEGIRRTAVLVTIDAEIAPHTSDWKRDSGRFALDRDVYGITPQGERGLRHQLDVIEQHGLKSVVFVEALNAGVLGFDLLEEIVGLVQGRGHEVALHIHTEWLSYYPRPLLGDRFGRHMCDFSEDDQQRLIDQGLENLSRVGAGRIVALRAGNGGANVATLRAARAKQHPDRLELFCASFERGLSPAFRPRTHTPDASRRRNRGTHYVVPRWAGPDQTGPALRLLNRRVRAPPHGSLEPRLASGDPAVALL